MGNGQNKQLDEGWALVAGDFCMQQGLWPSLSSFYIILPSTSTLKKTVWSAAHLTPPTRRWVDHRGFRSPWTSSNLDLSEIKLNHIRVSLAEFAKSDIKLHLVTFLSLLLGGGAYQDILLCSCILILCISIYIFYRSILNMYIDWSLCIFLTNHLRSSKRFVDTSIGKHHQHMRCNTDVSGSKHLIRWHLSDTKSPTSLDASRMKLKPLQVEVEESDSKNCSTLWLTWGWLHSDRFSSQYFFVAVNARQALAAVVMLLRLQGAWFLAGEASKSWKFDKLEYIIFILYIHI